MSFAKSRLNRVSTFSGLGPEALALLEERLRPLEVERGTVLVKEGQAATALYVVVSGRFAVEVSGVAEPVTEIGQGATIGEIAFFAGGARTATVTAIRDSVVVRLTREDFDEISRAAPQIWTSVAATLASRLAAETRKSTALSARASELPRAASAARTIVVIPAGPAPIPDDFIQRFMRAGRDLPGTLVVDRVPNGGDRGQSLTETLHALEAAQDTVVFIADNDLTEWSRHAIRQADMVLAVGVHPDGPLGHAVPANAVENFAMSLLRPAQRRLAIVHARRGSVQGTRHWLTGCDALMHHHIWLGDDADIARLWRFLTGRAQGLVLCGGGAYCAAHIGVYRAFREAGEVFDYFGGTSGGAAMAAAFAQDLPPEDVDQRVHRMFIAGKALGRYTLPYFGLLDHTHFDCHLKNEYGNVNIEDMWAPYFAVSAELSRATMEVHRFGPLWEAVRASAAIPGLLPPFFASDGRTLVDGSVIANVPTEVMQAVKSGPNVIVSFEPPETKAETIDYTALPDRRALIWRWLNPFSASALPKAPSAATVLVRSLMANRGHFERHIGADDWLLVPPTPQDMGALDWRRHSALADAAYQYTAEEIRLRRQEKPSLA